MQPGNPFILCPCRGKKRKIGQIFPPLCPDFVCFLALLFFGWFFFFKNASCFNSPPDIEAFALSASSPCLSALARLSPSLSLSLSPSLSLWPTDCHTDCTGRDLCPHVTSLTHTSRHADRNVISFIKTGLHAHCNFI